MTVLIFCNKIQVFVFKAMRESFFMKKLILILIAYLHVVMITLNETRFSNITIIYYLFLIYQTYFYWKRSRKIWILHFVLLITCTGLQIKRNDNPYFYPLTGSEHIILNDYNKMKAGSKVILKYIGDYDYLLVNDKITEKIKDSDVIYFGTKYLGKTFTASEVYGTFVTWMFLKVLFMFDFLLFIFFCFFAYNLYKPRDRNTDTLEKKDVAEEIEYKKEETFEGRKIDLSKAGSLISRVLHFILFIIAGSGASFYFLGIGLSGSSVELRYIIAFWLLLFLTIWCLVHSVRSSKWEEFTGLFVIIALGSVFLG